MITWGDKTPRKRSTHVFDFSSKFSEGDMNRGGDLLSPKTSGIYCSVSPKPWLHEGGKDTREPQLQASSYGHWACLRKVHLAASET